MSALVLANLAETAIETGDLQSGAGYAARTHR